MIYRVFCIEPDGTKRVMGDWKSEQAARRHIEVMLDDDGPHGEDDYQYERISEAKGAALDRLFDLANRNTELLSKAAAKRRRG